MGEDGSFAGGEATGLGVVDLGANDIGGQHVGGELEAAEPGVDSGGEGFDGEGFGQAGNALEQDMAIGEEADEETFDKVFLADDDLVEFGEQGVDEGAGLAHLIVDGTDPSIHEWKVLRSDGGRSKICSGAVDVRADLGAEGVERPKALFGPEAVMEDDLEQFAVEIAFVVEEVHFETQGGGAGVEGGAPTEI